MNNYQKAKKQLKSLYLQLKVIDDNEKVKNLLNEEYAFLVHFAELSDYQCLLLSKYRHKLLKQ